MKIKWLIIAGLCVLLQTPAHAINAKYARQLERAGCTQASELQGCDITKRREENAKAGFALTKPAKHKHAGRKQANSDDKAVLPSPGNSSKGE